MCGICGQFNFASSAPVSHRTIQAMTNTLVHRGPDDEGFYLDGPLGFGFRRLSIIDLEGGHQPMSDEQESVWVVFNGEIYNFLELRDELQGYGHRFRTQCDTEVIVNGYKQWGDEVFNHLNGMFGVAIWDSRRRRLVIARDPFGIKLIYYRVANGKVTFGSEIRPVLAATGQMPEIDTTAINLFLRYRYTPSPYTLYEGIRKLAPGTMLSFEDGKWSLTRWYRYRPVPFSPMKSVHEAQEELAHLYKLAMKRHLLSDVPVGLLLSGGVDSTLLLALMNLHGEQWRTYTVGYGTQFKDDELSDAEKTARHFSARHTSVLLDRKAFDEALPEIVASLEEPIASSSVVPMYFVCKRARETVKVALMGQGPDELFGGYRRHLGVQYGRLWRFMPDWLQRSATAAVSILPRNETLKRGLHSLDISDRMRRYQNVLSLMPADKIDGLFQGGVLAEGAGDEVLKCWDDFYDLTEDTTELGGFQFLELRSTLPDELLMYADKLSMAHGLEVRVPYLDKEIVEFAERLAPSLKLRMGAQKWIHRRVCREIIPADVLRRKKRGFAVNVVDDWFRDRARNTVAEVLLDHESKIFGFLSPSAVKELIEQHESGRNDNHKVLFSLVVLEQWLRAQSWTSVPA